MKRPAGRRLLSHLDHQSNGAAPGSRTSHRGIEMKNLIGIVALTGLILAVIASGMTFPQEDGNATMIKLSGTVKTT